MFQPRQLSLTPRTGLARQVTQPFISLVLTPVSAFWTVGDNWPNNGEIDILENVNLSKNNQYTLHTGPNSTCTIDPSPAEKFKTSSGAMGKTCASKEGANAGCGFADPDEASYGQGFNNAGGAVIAMEWQTTGIRICEYSFGLSSFRLTGRTIGRFGRNAIPADLQGDAKKPNPSTWGTPVAAWSSSTCNIANEVKVRTRTLCPNLMLMCSLETQHHLRHHLVWRLGRRPIRQLWLPGNVL